ncbi:hybrid sensor histidine kinase/response regulator [Pleurocapsa sp. PCC 7319]|uniref:ATP-binding response regulator n=1 Tax=Pleurocapsa sp. PCC 7319 TaxID=118161 RepID=UPI0003460FD7|nr:hybrid sensor histidine kinase/response regulator [Pleurocapsa sp. PCC 7319]
MPIVIGQNTNLNNLKIEQKTILLLEAVTKKFMFSPNLTLNDFVCPIPVCQSKADLVSILRIFQHSSCDFLAIPRENSTWGTISSKNLLLLLAQVSQYSAIATKGNSRSLSQEETYYPLTRQDLNKLIEPAIIFQSDTKLEDFLDYLKEPSQSNQEAQYLIVNHQGNLKGFINTEKLLKSLVFKFNPLQTVSSNLPVMSIPYGSADKRLIDLIESIPLPLKLETAEGQDLFMNQCWKKLIVTGKELVAQKSQTNDLSLIWQSIKSEQSHYQQNAAQKNSNQNYQLGTTSHASNCLCLASDYHVISPINIPFQNTHFNFESEQLTTKITHSTAPSCLWDNVPLDWATNSPLSIQIDRGKDWSYLKIPLTLIVPEKLSNTTESLNWLVLAIKSSLGDGDEQLPNKALATSETIANILLATISHELKSPLTGIVGLSSLLKAQKLGKLNQRQTRYVQLIHNSGQKLMSIVNELLELSNLTTGDLPLKSELVDLDSLCRQICQQEITKLQTSSVVSSDSIIQAPQLRLNIESGAKLAIADKSCLTTILSHLIVETIKYSQPLNKLEIKIKAVKGFTAIVISNDLEAEFSLSEQTADPLTPLSDDFASLKGQSSLNLIIAKYLAKVLEGDLLFSFAADSCQFTLLLPKSNSQPVHFLPNLSPTINEHQCLATNVDAPLIMLINNNLDRVDELTCKLKELGYRVVLVRTGIEALKQIRKFKPKCVFLNPKLPDLNGKDLLSLLRLDSRTQDIPIFIFTSPPHQPNYQHLYQQANGFITFSPDKFTLEKILPTVKNSQATTKQNLTILCLYPEPEVINSEVPNINKSGLDFNLKKWAEQDWSNSHEEQLSSQYRIIEAEGLEQAHTLARIWQLDVIVLDGYQIAAPSKYLRSLQESKYLSALPLITLDTKTTEAANQIENLKVYPCLLPAQCRRVSDLMQVIQIATSLE